MVIGSVLFSAGRGERLRPLTDRVPKPILPVLDIPLGAFLLRALADDCPPVVVNVARLGGFVTETLVPVLGRSDAVQTLVETPEPYGTAGTLVALQDRLTSTFVVAAADRLIDLAPRDLLRAHRATEMAATVVVERVATAADFELEGDRIVSFIDRRRRPDRSGARYIGMAALEPSVLSLVPHRVPAGLGETVLRRLADDRALAAYVHDGYTIDVGTPRRYLEASIDVLHGRAPQPPAPLPGRVVEVPGGLAYVGPDADAAPGTLGRDAIVLRGAVVSPGARIERALVWPDETVPAEVTLRDSIWAFARATGTA